MAVSKINLIYALASSLLIVLLAIPSVIAHASSNDVYVRVVSANPDTKTYTFSCRMDPENSHLRDWFIRPDNGDLADEAEEAMFLDKPSGQFLTYTFNQNTFYHIGCVVVDNTGGVHRGDLHIDLRSSPTVWNPYVKPVSGTGLSSTLQCVHSNSNPVTWEVVNAKTLQVTNIGSANPITHTVPGHGLFDYRCHVSNAGSTQLAVEYFDQGAPYFPDKQGVPDGVKNVWNRGSTSPPPCSPTNETCDGKDNDCDSMVDENNVCGTTSPPPSTGCFNNIQNIPATCTGGTITTDSYNGCRTIICSNGADSMKTLSCDKPDNSAPQYFEMYLQGKSGTKVSDICIGSTCIKSSGYVKSSNYPVCTGSTTPPPPSCTPTTETCDQKDNDCDGIVDENNVCATAPPPSQTCYSSVQNFPPTCNGGTISSDIWNGCRSVTCSNGASSLKILSCNKPDGSPNYFEMYNQGKTGSAVNSLCFGNTCISNNGYAKSPNFPVCTTSTTPPPSCTPTTETCDQKDNDCDGMVDENNVCSTTPPPSQTCYSSLQNIPVSCEGSIIQDTFDGCRTLVCSNAGSSVKVLGCDKPSVQSPTYFEMYKQSQTGSALKVCFGSTCITDSGFAKSSNYPYCTSGSSTGTNGTSTTNTPPNAPTWIEPSAGKSDVDVTDFHIHAFPMTDAENGTHIATDFEMWDDAVNERIWSALGSKILTHIHNADGTFEGNLAGQNMLKYNHPYRLRVRFYENAPANNVSAWSEWRSFKTRSQFTNTSTSTGLISTPSGWSVRSGYGVQLVAQGVSVPVNLAIAPDIYNHLSTGQQPLLYFTQLYGQVGMIKKDGTYVQYANNLLNYQSFGSLPGSGETGVDGIYVDPISGDLFVSTVYHDPNAQSGYYGKVIKFITNGNGDGFTSQQTILSGMPVSPSHHVHQITRGPDGKLYISVGDADDPFNAKNPGAMSGKILRFNDDGSNPGGNPWGNLVWAAGFRNAFGTAWRPGTSELFATNNGADSDDGVYRVTAGKTFGWCCNTATDTWHLWPQTTAPVAAAFDSGSSGFPSDSSGSLYVGLSGSTYSQGPQPIAKRIVQFKLNADGSKQSVSDFLVYNGSGFSAPIGLAFGNDGLYFTDIYGEAGFTGAGQTKGNIYKVVFGGSSSPAPGNPGFWVALGPGRWYPKGLEMVWECKQNNGVGPFKYDFFFGDGSSQQNIDSFSVYKKYAAAGTYTASCTARDLGTGKSASTSTSITLKECAPSDFQCNPA